MVSGLIGARTTNLIDLQYLYYLPFCQVFSSGDKVHTILEPALLEKHQSFINKDKLKADLSSLSKWWTELSLGEKNEWDRKYGHRPPTNNDSITYQLWEKYIGSWSPLEGNRVHDMTNEENKAEVKRIKDMLKN